jgi:hypothetical protein
MYAKSSNCTFFFLKRNHFVWECRIGQLCTQCNQWTMKRSTVICYALIRPIANAVRLNVVKLGWN